MSLIHLKSSSMVLVKGTIKLWVILGTDDKVRTEEVKFYVVDQQSPYNAILVVSCHVAFDMVVCMSHQRAKFNTCQGIGMIKSDPKVIFVRMVIF